MTINREISSKVLVVSEDYKGKGGVAIVVRNLLEYYDTVNYVRSTARVNKPLQLLIYLKCVLNMLYFFLFKDVRVVHIHSASYGSFFRKAILILLSKFFRKKIILHIHSGHFSLFYDEWNKFNFIRRILNIPDVIIVLTESWKKYFSTIVRKGKVIVLNNLIPYPNRRKKVLLDQNKISLLFLGAITENKGIFDLLYTIIENKSFFRENIILNIGGVGDINKLQHIIITEGLSDFVFYKGWIDKSKKEDLLNSSDIFILLSYYEGISLAILEALSYNIPVIATKVGGIPSIVKHYYNGILVSPGDKKGIWKSITYFINNKNQIKIMGNNGSNIAQYYYADVVIPSLNKIYKDLLV